MEDVVQIFGQQTHTRTGQAGGRPEEESQELSQEWLGCNKVGSERSSRKGTGSKHAPQTQNNADSDYWDNVHRPWKQLGS